MKQVQSMMDALPEFFRAIRADLVEKHLWPLAVLLVAAVVAIPVGVKMTSKNTNSATPAPAPAPAPAPGVGVGAPGPAVAATPHQGHLGALHDPFGGSGAAKPSTPGASTPASGTAVRVTPAASSQGTTTGKTGAGTGGQAAKPAPVQPVHNSPQNHAIPVKAKSLRVYHVSFHFGQGTNVAAYSDVVRLTALPSVTTPVAQFLGAMQSGSKAAFLLWNPVSASGDGVCRRGKTACDILELKPGGSEFVDVALPGSGTVQFELDLDSINVTHAKGAVQARNAHARQSTPGISLLLKSTATALSQLKYSTILGTLVSASTKAASATFHPHAYVSGWGPQTQQK
jgi:hypothetical protein